MKQRFWLLLLLLSSILAACRTPLEETTESSSIIRPSEESAEVGFARDMIMHHLQAIEMSYLLYDRTTSADLRLLAQDIIQTQTNQVGQMQAWLELWDYDQYGGTTRMAWMGMASDELMPGMATAEQMEALRQSEGQPAEVIFFQLMNAHHYSGIHMAESAERLATNPVVQNLARTMKMAQTGEITMMEGLLRERGVEPLPPPTPHIMPEGHQQHTP